jgi:hypothetical protein
VDKAEREQHPRIAHERIEERRQREEEPAQNHHSLAPEYIGERSGGQLEENAGDRGGGDDDADKFRKRAETGGEGGQNGASRHLIAETREQAREHDSRERVHRTSPGQDPDETRPVWSTVPPHRVHDASA